MDLQKVVKILSVEELIDLWRYLYLTRYILLDPRLGPGGQQQIDRVKRQMRYRIRYIIYRLQNPNDREVPLGLDDSLDVDKWLDDNGLVLKKSRVGPRPSGTSDFFDFLVAKIHTSKYTKWHEEMVRRSLPLTQEELDEYVKILEESGVYAAESWLIEKGRLLDIIRVSEPDGSEHFLTKMTVEFRYETDGTRTSRIVGGDLIPEPTIYDVMYEIKLTEPANFVDLIDFTPDLEQTRIEELISDIVRYVNLSLQSPLTGLDYYDLSKGSGSFELVDNPILSDGIISAILDEMINYTDIMIELFNIYNLSDLTDTEKKERIKKILKDQLSVIGNAAYSAKYHVYAIGSLISIISAISPLLIEKYAIGTLSPSTIQKLVVLSEKIHHFDHINHTLLNTFKTTKMFFAPGLLDTILGQESTESKLADLGATLLMISNTKLGYVGIITELLLGGYKIYKSIKNESEKVRRAREAEERRLVPSPYINYGIEIKLDSLYFAAAPANQDLIDAFKEVGVPTTDRIVRVNKHRIPRFIDPNTFIYDFADTLIQVDSDNTSVISPTSGPSIDLFPLTPTNRINGSILEMLNENPAIRFHFQQAGLIDKEIPEPYFDPSEIPDLFDPGYSTMDMDWLSIANIAIEQFGSGQASREDIDSVLSFNSYVGKIHEEVIIRDNPNPICDIDFIDENNYMNWFIDLEYERFNIESLKIIEAASANGLITDTVVGGIPIKTVETKTEIVTTEKRNSKKKKESSKGVALPNTTATKTTPSTNTEKRKTPPSPGKNKDGTARQQNSRVYPTATLSPDVGGEGGDTVTSKIPKTNRTVGATKSTKSDRNTRRSNAYNSDKLRKGQPTIPSNSDVEAIINTNIPITRAPLESVGAPTGRRGGGTAGGPPTGGSGGSKFGDPNLDFNVRGGPSDIEFIETQQDDQETGGRGGGTPPPKESLTCLFGTSKISTPNGLVEIKDIKVGDEVFAFDWFGNLFTSNVIESIYHPEKTEVFNYELSNGSNVFITDNHAILTNDNKFVQIGSLNIGDPLILENGECTSIVSKESIGVHETYNILTEKVGTYIADGIRVWGSDWFTEWSDTWGNWGNK